MSRLSYLRIVRRTRLVLRELRRLERSEGARRVWQPMSSNLGVRRDPRGSTSVVMVDTTVSNAKMDPRGRPRASGKRGLVVIVPSPFATANIRWRGLQKTAQACREAAAVLEVMTS